MNELRKSKYCFFIVMSFVDVSHKVNNQIISKLSKHFREYSLDKSQDGQNMLVKESVTFQVWSQESVRNMAKLNLLHYKFGLNIHIQHLKPLLTILKSYEKPRLLSLLPGPECFVIDARRPSKATKAI